MLQVVLATTNRGKVEELRALLGGLMELHPRPEDLADVVEDAPDLEGNARLKAVALTAATGMAALADDTGLEVDALGGRPGVRSARYAGQSATDSQNRRLLLDELERLGDVPRDARFRTVALLRFVDGTEVTAEGRVDGTILDVERGEAGFGYDALFVPAEGDGRTFAEMSGPEKNALSHRGRAIRSLVELLAERA